jgi:hypothetical protein
VLFSDSGNGECAANQCLKWTKDAKGLVEGESKPEFFNIFVGNSNTSSKTITLPGSGITVFPSPINPQNPSWGNKFKVAVKGTQLKVTRTDKKSGWDQMLQLQGIRDTAGFKSYTINVGKSNQNPKEVTLPETGLTVDSEPINPQMIGGTDKFNAKVMGQKLVVTRTDKNTGWDQDLQLRAVLGNTKGILMENKACQPGLGPKQTNYVYSGWTKPEWRESPNVSFMGDPMNADSSLWKDLGGAKNLAACKEMSYSSENGPFSSVVFVNNGNKCYGGVPDAHQQSVKMNGVYSAIPPSGSTNIGGPGALQYIEKLKLLNKELKDDLYQMNQILSKQENTRGKLNSTRANVQSDYQKLAEDRKKLDVMSADLTDLDVKLGILKLVGNRERIIYLGSAFIALLGIAYFIRKSS